MAKSLIPADARAAIFVAVLLITVGIAIGGEGAGVAVFFLVYLTLLYAASKVPLRYSLYTLMFCALTLENPAEVPAGGVWQSPIYPVGALLLNHMNAYTSFSALSFSGMDVCLVTLLGIAFARRASQSKIDTAGHIQTPKPLVRLALLSLGGTLLVWLGGLVRGGDFRWSLWQVDRVMYLPIIFLLFHMGLRGPKDHMALGKLILGASLFRAMAAFIIVKTIHYEDGSRLVFATSHHDSILFATGFVLVLAAYIERVGAHSLRRAILALPVIALGIWANNRRMAWVQVALVFLTIYFVTPDNRAKRLFRRALTIGAPFAAVYCAAGWNDQWSTVFKPVRILRSIVDSKSDGSTLWRDLENFNLIMTLRGSPVLGAGYGHGYEEIITMPDVPYELEKYVPHNSILGLWAFAGYFGYTAMTLLWAVGVYFAMRSYRMAKEAEWRAAALVSSGAVLIYLIQCWGDMGLGTWTGVWIVAPSIAVAGKLAIATGAWPSKQKASVAVPQQVAAT